MARPNVSFDDEDLFQFVRFDREEDIGKAGAWDDGGSGTLEDGEHLSLNQATPDEPVVGEDGRRFVETPDYADVEAAQEFVNWPQGVRSGYFIGQVGQRNAPTNVLAARSETGSMGFRDATNTPIDDLDGEQIPVDGMSIDFEADWTRTNPTTQGWSFLESNVGAAGPSAANSEIISTGRPALQAETGLFVCGHPDCGASYNRSSKLRHHQRKHIPMAERPWQCPLCPEKRFLYQKDLDKHLQSRRHATPQFQCPRCLRMFTRGDLLNRHRRNHCHRTDAP